MIVRPVTDIKWYLENAEFLEESYTYDCEWHSDQTQKTFRTNPTFVIQLEDVVAHQLPFIITKNNLMLSDHVWPLLHKTKHKPYKSHGLWQTWGEKLQIRKPCPTKYYKGKDIYVWLPIDSQSSNNAWHFWIDVVSKIRLIQMSMSAYKNVFEYVYVFPNVGPYMSKAIKELLPDLKVLIMGENEYWHFEHLLVPSMSNHLDGVLTPGLPKWLYDTFAQKKNAVPTRKIFISREDAPARQLSNTEELFMALKGWEKLNLSELSLKEQIKIFNETSHVMTTHGAGLVNTVWCPPGATIIEISQKELIDKKPYPILSMLKKHQHHVITAGKVPLGTNKPKNVKRLKDYNNLKIDLKDVLRLI